MSLSSPPDVTVIGAGIVGISTALSLQREGLRVRVVDPRPPGTATSFGNAGALVGGSVLPISTPELRRSLPGLLLNPTSPLRIRWRYLPWAAPWLWRFWRAGDAARVEAIADALFALSSRAYQAHRELQAHCGISGMLRDEGWLKVYRSPVSFEGTARERALLERLGVRHEIFDSAQLRQLEPGLAPLFSHGILYVDSAAIRNPHQLVDGLARRFVADGGELLQESVRRVEVDEGGPRQLVTDLGMYPLNKLVVAAGAWSKPLARQLGARVSLDTERGYHLNLNPPAGPGLSRAVYFSDHGFVLAPMSDGYRLTSGAELAGLEAPPSLRRIYRLLPTAREVLPGLGAEVSREWLGFRPSTPDSLPVIGPAPLPRVFFAFGHGHLGMTLGPITGQLVRDLVLGRTPPVDLAPYRAERFWTKRGNR